METQLPPNSRSFSFASMRIKKRHHSNEEGGFTRRRGLMSFSSVRETSRKEPARRWTGCLWGEAAMSETVTRRRKGQGPKNLQSRWTAIPSGEDDAGRPGALKRLGAMWSSFRRHKRDGFKDSEPPELPGQVAENSSRQHRYVSGQYFFEYLVVVSLKKTKDGSSYEPQITYQFPKKDGMAKYQKEEEEKTLKAITLFCFPEGINWAPLTEYPSETFSFVLTEIDGSRRNGYCRRLLVMFTKYPLLPLAARRERSPPPEAYCIISTLACFGLFSKILEEVEKRRQISTAMIYPFMQKLREAPFPAPGHTVEIKSFIPESGTEIISLTRPLDSWLEHVNFATLFDCLTDEEVLLVFAAAVLERRIVFIAEELGTLSQIIHAVAALLYPFTWQHTMISIVPEILIDVVMAPTPYLLGVQKHLLDLVTDQTDVGDESSILPPKLKSEILEALSARQKASMGHFRSYVKHSRGGGPGVFEKRSFYKAIDSKTTRHFVKLFLQTQMFDLFIQEVEQQQPGPQQGIFNKKILEYQEKKKKEKAKKH
ncbi:hypothetical protein F7725_000209 [Dissostichus mawsoni]|uniref:UDENN domain-containing protein n=1 Tax=Dissostichus mawsoni TaxID=36200 RepID=A0A7J5ZDQ5_DISMA|nr:hypothetical protein F7725_000209 [Dissostichus mawsoni]